MSARFTFRGLDSRPKLEASAKRSLDFALGRFEDQIREVEVVLEDMNGHKGGLDKRCRIELALAHGGRMRAVVVDTDGESALRRAAARARRLVQERLATYRSRRRSVR